MAEEPSLRDPEIEACLAEIAAARERLGVALGQAKSLRSLNPLDWRNWFRRYPVESTLGAFAAGLLLSGTAGSSRGDGAPTLLEDLSRAGFETALQLLLKTL